MMETRERGLGHFMAILWLLILAALIYLAAKLLPPYIDNYQLQDDLTTIARYSSYAPNKTEDDIRNEVIGKGREHDVLLKPENVTVEKTGTTVNIDVHYMVHVDLPAHPVDLSFNPSAGNKIITAK